MSSLEKENLKISEKLARPKKIAITTFNRRRSLMEDDLQWKTTFDGRQSSDGRRALMEDTFNGRRPLCFSSIFPARAIDHLVLLLKYLYVCMYVVSG